jgi:hypothetical protein
MTDLPRHITNQCYTVPYCSIVFLTFVYRYSSFTGDGSCIIGIQSQPLIALIVLDAALNLYLTLLFVVPLQSK